MLKLHKSPEGNELVIDSVTGESIADYKARRPVFAEALENDHTNERFSPDHSDVAEIQKLVLLRRSFVRAKQAHKSNPYAVGVSSISQA